MKVLSYPSARGFSALIALDMLEVVLQQMKIGGLDMPEEVLQQSRDFWCVAGGEVLQSVNSCAVVSVRCLR